MNFNVTQMYHSIILFRHQTYWWAHFTDPSIRTMLRKNAVQTKFKYNHHTGTDVTIAMQKEWPQYLIVEASWKDKLEDLL